MLDCAGYRLVHTVTTKQEEIIIDAQENSTDFTLFIQG